jgi:Zn-dependent peptidase ImmA (M78 family)
MTLGDPELLQFQLQWDPEEPAGTAATATRGSLVVRLAGRTVWGATSDEPNGFSWTWVELVEHLARYWAYLFVEESDPLGLGVPPERLRARAEERWNAVSSEQQAEEEEALWAYLESHDLASAVQGAYPASLWITREGSELRVACKGVVVGVPLASGRATLGAVGDAIVSRLAALGSEARAEAAVIAWERREEVAPLRLAEIATGLGQSEVEALGDVVELPFDRLDFEEAFESDQYLAVARMARGAIPTDELRSVFAIMRAQPAIWTGPIDRLAEGAAEALEVLRDKRAFEQGHAVALWLREKLSIQDADRAEPEALLEGWKIPLVEVRLSSRDLDAVSIWGGKHGPAVIVNLNGRHGRMNGRRATIAHEIGHLVMDRQAALPVAEVMGGRVSNRVEVRARAFAASFLMPGAVAARDVVMAKNTRELTATLSRLSGQYGASREIVAWQAYNAHDRRLPPMVYTHLRSQGLLNPDRGWDEALAT